MSVKSFLISSVVVLIFVATAAAFSRHGIVELRKLQVQIETAKSRIAQIENENRELKRQVDLLEESSEEITEIQVRTVLGLMKPDEIVYLENTRSRPGR